MHSVCSRCCCCVDITTADRAGLKKVGGERCQKLFMRTYRKVSAKMKTKMFSVYVQQIILMQNPEITTTTLDCFKRHIYTRGIFEMRIMEIIQNILFISLYIALKYKRTKCVNEFIHTQRKFIEVNVNMFVTF